MGNYAALPRIYHQNKLYGYKMRCAGNVAFVINVRYNPQYYGKIRNKQARNTTLCITNKICPFKAQFPAFLKQKNVIFPHIKILREIFTFWIKDCENHLTMKAYYDIIILRTYKHRTALKTQNMGQFAAPCAETDERQ